MLVVGITGGIGSGKTTVCRIFELLGAHVFYADEEAKKLYDDKQVISKLVKLFGKKILGEKKTIDRKKLAELVFNDRKSLIRLNAIVHPAVKKKFYAWKKERKRSKYVIKEAAILIESGAYKDVDFIISVNASKLLRIKRISERDGLSEKEIKSRMKEQMSDKEREKYSDAVILNDGTRSLIEQVLDLHRSFLRK